VKQQQDKTVKQQQDRQWNKESSYLYIN